MLADEGTFEEWDRVMPISNPLSYKGYEEKVKSFRKRQIWTKQLSQERQNRRNICSALECVTAVFSWPVWEKMWEKKLQEQWKGQHRNGCL